MVAGPRNQQNLNRLRLSPGFPIPGNISLRPDINGNFRRSCPPLMIDLNLSARCWQRVFPEPWGSGFKDTKVPASTGSQATRTASRRRGSCLSPVYHGLRGYFCGSQPPQRALPLSSKMSPQQGCVRRSWRISSMERTVAKVVPLFRQMTSMRAVESLTSHQPQRRSSMMPSRLIAAAFLLSPLLPARSIDARKVGAVQANGEGGFFTGVSLSIGGNDSYP